MNNLLGKVCAAVCLVGAVLVAPACGESDSKSNCAANQSYATYGGTTACFDNCDEGQCAAGSKCNSGICVPDGSTPGNNPTSNSNNPTSNSINPTSNSNNPTSNSNNPTTNSPTGVSQAAIDACNGYVELYYGCFDSCTLDADFTAAIAEAKAETLNGDGTTPSCAEQLSADAMLLASIQDYVSTQSCESLAWMHCGRFGLMDECSQCTPPSNLGSACTASTDCNGGSLDGICIKVDPNDQASQGICGAAECPDLSNEGVPDGFAWRTSVCGANGYCEQRQSTDGDGFGVCFGECSNNAACAPIGGVCVVTGLDWATETVIRGCGVATCGSNADCGEGSRCNSAGVCEFGCDGTQLDPNEPLTWDQLCTNSGGTCTYDAGLQAEFCVL